MGIITQRHFYKNTYNSLRFKRRKSRKIRPFIGGGKDPSIRRGNLGDFLGEKFQKIENWVLIFKKFKNFRKICVIKKHPVFSPKNGVFLGYFLPKKFFENSGYILSFFSKKWGGWKCTPHLEEILGVFSEKKFLKIPPEVRDF